MADTNATKKRLESFRSELAGHFENELLPFWLERCRDDEHGGFLTQFDEHGHDSGEDEKSLIAQSRTVYSMSRAHLAGFGGDVCRKNASHGVRFLVDRMWDKQFGGFVWMTDRSGKVTERRKIAYGHSFAIYALSTCYLTTGDTEALEYAIKTFELLQTHAVDTFYGGYYEMFEPDWTLSPGGAGGGDRKTLDVHMHLMEAFTALYAATKSDTHRRKLVEIIEILLQRVIHPEFKTGIPQFYRDWSEAPQIKFDIIWGWDRFAEGGVKPNASDNTSAGHNAEFGWLLLTAADVLQTDEYLDLSRIVFDHVVANGIDPDHGGVYVEGPHAGGVYDMEKEFWQQAEVMIGMLEAYKRFGERKYLEAYENVHRFVIDYGINHAVGEWWPLLTREGEPIWRHMSHSWKVNYHSIRGVAECLARLDELISSQV